MYAGQKNGKILDAASRGRPDTAIRTEHAGTEGLSTVNWPVVQPHVARIVATVDVAVPGSYTRVDVGGSKDCETVRLDYYRGENQALIFMDSAVANELATV